MVPGALFTRTGDAYPKQIASRDSDINKLGLGIVNPVGMLRITVWIIHLFEKRAPSKITEILSTYKKTYLKVN